MKCGVSRIFIKIASIRIKLKYKNTNSYFREICILVNDKLI